MALSLASVAHASELSPRAEVSVKGGSERSTLTTEFWAPLAQKSDRVVYTDLRLMGDDDDNREGNLGIGYRQIYEPTNSVLGVHGWIDRRRTEHNSTFHQATFGVESLGDKIDLRANGYIPLNGSHVVTTPNLGSATPYLAGSGLFYDTTGSVAETPQYGMDVEAGYRLPIFEKQVDTIRVFGGSYYFFRDNTDSVLGGRARIESQINSIFSIGARFQYDKPRGSQGFLEATLRFPFSAKKLYQKSGLVSRLDESPERDIDIVTASKVDTGLRKEITNASGTQQRILYVDNTNTQTGDGTKEHPFNNLTSAQAALQANDILYVFRGDGTTHNMDQGITIDKANVSLIGSGSALTLNGYTFLNASTAPVITNTLPTSSSFTGNGILVTADNGSVSGITVSSATLAGVNFRAEDTSFHNVSLSNVTLIGNKAIGFSIKPGNGNTIENIVVDNVIISGSINGAGGFIGSDLVTGGRIDNIVIKNSLFTGNNGAGININSVKGAQLGNVTIENNTITGGVGTNGYGINVQGAINNVSIANNLVSNNSQSGIRIGTTTGEANIINSVTINNNTVIGNTTYGIIVTSFDGGKISNVTIDSNLSSSNKMTGIYLSTYSATASEINNAIIKNNTSINNVQHGISFVIQNASSLSAIVSGNNVTLNGAGSGATKYYGLNIDNDSIGTVTVDVGGGSLGSTGQNRIFNNTYQDVFIDSMPTSGTTTGVTISAQHNWWGNASGLIAGRRTLDGTSGIDSTAFLTTDPRP
jgi:hypothetical protein